MLRKDDPETEKKAPGKMLSKTDRVDILNKRLSEQIGDLRSQIKLLEQRRQKINQIAHRIEEPHALVPKRYNDVNAWLQGHPFPTACIDHVFKNKALALERLHTSDNYQKFFHIIKCEPREFYEAIYLNKPE